MSGTLPLVRRAQGGSTAAFSLLFQRHRARLQTLVASRMTPFLRARLDAEDIVQESYAEAARQFADFRPDVPQAFYRWLTAIAGFKLKEAERAARAQKRGRPEALLHEPAAPHGSVACRARQDERAPRIAQAVEGRPGAQAQAVRLRYLQGCSLAETAERLGRSEAAVKALVSRGLLALARLAPRSL
jgi:RNA polymerase sigma-70 factor (ECF subfamily)